MFRDFQTKYYKTYPNKAEKVKRFKIWKQRTDLMKDHNELFHKGEKAYTKGENAMFDMTPEEIEESYMGLSLDVYPKSYSSKVSTDISHLPSFVNWTEKGHVTPVQNQVGCGSCWAYSAAGALEGSYKKDTNRLANINVSYLIDCITDGCKKSNPVTAFTHIMLNGIVIDNEVYRSPTSGFRHEAQRSPTNNSFSKTHGIHETFGTLTNNSFHADQNRKSQCELENKNAVIIRGIWRINNGREDKLMEAVAKIGPVSVLICASMDLVDYAGEVDEVFYEENCSAACNIHPHVNHAALVVGYGKQINERTGENESYWLVKNSWGTDWGNEVLSK